LKFIYKHYFNAENKVGGIFKKGLTGATRNLYSVLVEYEEIEFLPHLLRPIDLFIDIGVNVEAYFSKN
jgi:hypothetical protein